MRLSLLWLLHSMFYEVFLCPRIRLFLSGCICLSICQFFLHVQTILDDLTSALIVRFNRPYIFDRLTFSSVFIFSIQLDIACSLRKRRCTSSLSRGQHSLVWSKAPLTQLSHKFPRLAKEIVVNVRRGSSSRNFPHAALVRAIVTSSQPPPGQILSPR